jgi:outer membrane protein assembly factor BamA
MTSRDFLRHAVGSVVILSLSGLPQAEAQAPAASTQPAIPTTQPRADISGIAARLKGRRVEAIRVEGNTLIPTSVILNQVRTREGEPLDPVTVEEDYQRIYAMKRFSVVDAKVEGTDSGVIVVFSVAEQRRLTEVAFKGNARIDTMALQEAADIKPGEAFDAFRVSLARQGVERLYQQKNFPYARVSVDEQKLATTGELVFNIVEGTRVRIRRVTFEGNQSFSNIRLRGQVRSDYYLWIFRPGTFEFEQVEDDVASLRKFYEQKGFFDAKVGRKLSFGADQKELQITFVIDEGPRYVIDQVNFAGNEHVKDEALRAELKLVEGVPYDQDLVQRDIRAIVRAYSPYGYVYQATPATPNPDYMRIEPKTVFKKDAGKVDLVYEIREGKPFKMGRVTVKGNDKTQDKVILREIRSNPGELYNSAALTAASDRLKGLGHFNSVTMTPIGEDPEVRDVLVEISEARTASFNIGAGVSSNGGLGGEISYEQRNFDIGNFPSSWDDALSERAWVGAGQSFKASIAPSSRGTSAQVRFFDPWIFDQPYSFANDLYLRQRIWEDWQETRFGDRITVGKRLDQNWTVFLSARGEDVRIHEIDDEATRAPEVLDWEGHSTITGVGPSLRYDSTNRGPLLYRGFVGQLGYERVGALGGDAHFNKYSASAEQYITLYEDLFERKTILSLRVEGGYIDDEDAPLFERYYLGGYGSVRGFRYRGISPRSGPDEDAVGGVFMLMSSAQVSYPIYTDMIRGVVFLDGGTSEREFEVDTYRLSAGFGFRVMFPFAQQAPLAIDFGFPLNDGRDDDTQLISFSFGVTY